MGRVRQTKQMWTSEEDLRLESAVGVLGTDHWSSVAAMVGARSGKQCRERWINQLSPDVKRAGWSAEEDQRLMRLVEQLGPHWSILAKHITDRTDSAIKNRYLTFVRRGMAPRPNTWHSAQTSAERHATPPSQRRNQPLKRAISTTNRTTNHLSRLAQAVTVRGFVEEMDHTVASESVGNCSPAVQPAHATPCSQFASDKEDQIAPSSTQSHPQEELARYTNTQHHHHHQQQAPLSSSTGRTLTPTASILPTPQPQQQQQQQQPHNAPTSPLTLPSIAPLLAFAAHDVVLREYDNDDDDKNVHALPTFSIVFGGLCQALTSN